MNIIVKRSILFYADKYPKAKTALLTWYHEFSKHKFQNFNELKQVYGNASIVSNNRVIFNIKGNDYRLIVSLILNKWPLTLFGLGRTKLMIKSMRKPLISMSKS